MLHTLFTTIFRNVSHFSAIVTLYNGFGDTSQKYFAVSIVVGKKFAVTDNMTIFKEKGTQELLQYFNFLVLFFFCFKSVDLIFSLQSVAFLIGVFANAGRLATNISARLLEKAGHQPAPGGIKRVNTQAEN
jgi:hypothetical protein